MYIHIDGMTVSNDPPLLGNCLYFTANALARVITRVADEEFQVDGFDPDGPSIERARETACRNRVAGRVDFQVRDAGDPASAGRTYLVAAIECVHDMSDPVGGDVG